MAFGLDQPYPPDLAEAMRLAFRKTCEALQLRDKEDAFTDIVATRIVEVAKTGEGDPDQLCSRVLDTLSTSRGASEDKSTKQVARAK